VFPLVGNEREERNVAAQNQWILFDAGRAPARVTATAAGGG
jgi:hypothetical protein